MKTKLLTLGLVLVSIALFAQGKVGFANDSTRVFVFNQSSMLAADIAYAGQPVPTTGLPSGTELYATLYAGTSAGSLTLQTAVLLAGSNIPAPGRMGTKNVILNGVPVGLGFFQIFVSNNNGFFPATISSANDFQQSANPFYFGTSGLFNKTVPSSITYPVIWAPDSTWASGDLVIYGAPEPSVFAMIGISGAMLAVHRRRR